MRILLILIVFPLFCFSQNENSRTLPRVTPGVLDGVYIPENTIFEYPCSKDSTIKTYLDTLQYIWYRNEIPKELDTALCMDCPECFIGYCNFIFERVSVFPRDKEKYDFKLLEQRLIDQTKSRNVLVRASAFYLLGNNPFYGEEKVQQKIHYLSQYLDEVQAQNIEREHFFPHYFGAVDKTIFELLFAYQFHQTKNQNLLDQVESIYEKQYHFSPYGTLTYLYQTMQNDSLEQYYKAKLIDQHKNTDVSPLDLSYFIFRYLNGKGELFEFKKELKLREFRQYPETKDDLFYQLKIEEKKNFVNLWVPLSFTDTFFYDNELNEKQNVVVSKYGEFEAYTRGKYYGNHIILKNGKLKSIFLRGLFPRELSTNYYIRILYDESETPKPKYIQLATSNELNRMYEFYFKKKKVIIKLNKKKLKADSEAIWHLKKLMKNWGLMPWFKKDVLSMIK